MAIADTITSMQTHTSNAYTMIGYGTDLTGINKNLENLSSTIFEAFLEALRTPDTLFTNLPKKSGSGSVISLNDTANAPMRITLGASELTQDGTPTPSSPQDIHTISGSNKVKVRGKNLLNIASTYTLTGYKTISVDIPAGTYVLSVDNRISTADSSLVLFQNGNTTISQTYLSVGSLEKNINLSTKVDKMLIYSGGNYATSVDVETTFTNLMVSKNGGTYEPYISQEADLNLGDIEYCKIGNYEDKFIRSNDGTWQLKKNIGKVVLDGTSTINDYVGALTNVYVFTAPMNNMNNITSSGAGFCNMYNTIAWNYNLDSESYYLANSTLAFKINKTTIDAQTGSTNKEKCLSFLGSNNLILYGSLTIPTYTQITGTLETQLENIYQKLLSYTGTTNISQVNNDLGFVMSVSAIEEL